MGEGRGEGGFGGMGGCDGMGWDGMGWDGMGWDGMGWDGMGWDGMGVLTTFFMVKIYYCDDCMILMVERRDDRSDGMDEMSHGIRWLCI